VKSERPALSKHRARRMGERWGNLIVATNFAEAQKAQKKGSANWHEKGRSEPTAAPVTPLAIWDKDTKVEGNRIFVTWVDCYLRLFECLCVRMGQTMTRVVR
jgi:hypothetical protein